MVSFLSDDYQLMPLLGDKQQYMCRVLVCTHYVLLDFYGFQSTQNLVLAGYFTPGGSV